MLQNIDESASTANRRGKPAPRPRPPFLPPSPPASPSSLAPVRRGQDRAGLAEQAKRELFDLHDMGLSHLPELCDLSLISPSLSRLVLLTMMINDHPWGLDSSRRRGRPASGGAPRLLERTVRHVSPCHACHIVGGGEIDRNRGPEAHHVSPVAYSDRGLWPTMSLRYETNCRRVD
jgi:hypothetical protein